MLFRTEMSAEEEKWGGGVHALRLAVAVACLLLVSVTAFAKPRKPKELREQQQKSRAKEDPESALPSVGGIKWRGNKALSTSQLQQVTFTRAPTWRLWQPAPAFSESALIGDMARIRSLYRSNGFYEAQTHYSLVWNDSRRIVAITVEIEERDSVRTRELDIRVPAEADLTDKQRGALVTGLALIEGERFSPNRYAEAKEQLLDRMAELGYPTARVEGGATVEIPVHEASVSWDIVLGPLVHFGKISVAGLYKVQERTARHEVKIREGQRYSTSALARTRRGLQRQGLYAWVSVQARSPGPARTQEPLPGLESPDSGAGPAPRRVAWPVEIRLTERSPYTFDAGIGYSTDESVRATVGWRNGNFLGDGRNLRLTTLYSGILIKAQIEFTQPYFIDPALALIFRMSLRHEVEPAYTANRFLPSIGLSRPIYKAWRGRINYDFSYQNVTKTSPNVDLILDVQEGVSKVATLGVGMRRQTLDDLLDPHRGSWLDFLIAPSIDEFGSDFDYIGLLFEGRSFVPLGWNSVFAARLRIATLQPLRETTPEQIPVVSRFFSGGGNSFRGFQYHRLPPNGTTSDSVGGTSWLEASLEWRFPIWKSLRGVIFVDAAQLDLEPFTYPLDELFWAVGPGLRYDTIVGPLRFDFGTLLNPKDGSSAQFQWFISVGHSF